jgi:hypothetical protein
MYLVFNTKEAFVAFPKFMCLVETTYERRCKLPQLFSCGRHGFVGDICIAMVITLLKSFATQQMTITFSFKLVAPLSSVTVLVT